MKTMIKLAPRCLVPLLLTASALADPPRMISISIAKQDLATALVKLAEQTGCQFFAPQADMRGLSAPAIRGTLTVEEALTKLLAQSGLSYELGQGSCIFVIEGPNSRSHHASDGGAQNNIPQEEGQPGKSQRMSESHSQDEVATSGANVLEEVVVTAGKRAETAESLPTTLQVITGNELRELGAVNVQDYAGQVAGVSFTDMGVSGSKITMRGLATTNFSESQATVGIYVDETPVTDAGGAAAAFVPAFNLKLLDIDRIEVLKGPQGTLYGAGALAGAIRIITNQPDTKNFTGFAEASASAIQDGGINDEVAGAVNFPVASDVLGVRVLGYTVGDGGYINDESPLRHVDNVNDSHTTGGRVSVLFTPIADLRITATATNQSVSSGGSSVVTIGAPDLVQYRAAPENFTDKISMYNLLGEYQFSNARLVWSTSYSDRTTHVPFDITDQVASLFPGQPVQQNSITGANATSSELRLVSLGTSRFQWLGGIYYFNQDRMFSQYIPFVAGANNPLYGSSQPAVFREWAAFGELSYKFTDRLTGTAGLREFRDAISFHSVQDGFFEGGTVQVGGSGSNRSNTPKFNLAYQVTDGDLVYVSATKGYRRGGVNAVAPSALCAGDLTAAGYPSGVPPTYGPDTTWNYELGAKTLWAGGRLGVDVATYYINWTGLPVSVTLPCGITFNVNAAKARTIGSELTLRAQPTERLDFSATATYTDATLRSDVSAVDAVSSDRAPTVPQFTSSLAATYSFPIAGNRAFVHVDGNYVGSSNTQYNPQIGSPLPAYTLFNFRSGFKFTRYTVEAFVRNLGNERAQLSRFDDSFAHFIVVSQPRTFGLLARMNW